MYTQRQFFVIRVAVSCMSSYAHIFCAEQNIGAGGIIRARAARVRCHLIPYLEFDASCSLITRTYMHLRLRDVTMQTNQKFIHIYTVPAAYILMISLSLDYW